MLSGTDLLVVATYYSLLTILAIYGVHRLHLVRVLRRHDVATPRTPPPPYLWPDLTIQLPVFNEPRVVERLLEAAAGLDYPGKVDIQLLDDSSDETTALAEAKIAEIRARGVVIHHIRRASRTGYKAGALSEGLALTSSELVAVFDADFVPSGDLLSSMVPWFSDPEIGMVQARWEHLNRCESALTRVQAIYLDGHFSVESAARHLSGRFFNFNGTAGIWRRRAIIEAGGWSSSTLTEDLDLSYRAQLAGWKFVFMPATTVPAELPASLAGFQQQQHRWAKGSLQCARKLLPTILSSHLPWRTKVEAFFHLTNNISYLLTAILALMIVPSLVIREGLDLIWTLSYDLVLFGCSTVSVLVFYVEGQRRVGRRIELRELFWVLPVGVGVSLRNSAAVLEGLFLHGGVFERTPKLGSEPCASGLRGKARLPIGEAILATFFLASLIFLANVGYFAALPFVLLFLGGYGYISLLGIRERKVMQ